MTRSSIFDTIEQRFDEIRKELMDGLGEVGGAVRGMLTPAVDVIDRENEYDITIELPGVRKEEVKLEVETNAIRIRAEKERRDEEKDANFVRRERSHERYERYLTLPDEVSADGTRATFRDGILHVTIPKTSPEKRRARQVDIEG